MKTTHFLAGTAFLAIAAAGAQAQQVVLNEVYASMAGTDTTEFVELKGPANTSLSGYMVLMVEGDSTGAGILKRAFDISAGTIPASGLYLLADTAVTPKDFDMGAQDRLENGSETFYLIQTANTAAITALLNAHIDTSVTGTGSGTTQIPTLATILDSVGIVDTGFPATDTIFDGAPVLGPDGTFFPGGVVRCGDAPFGWSTQFLQFDVTMPLPGYTTPTPGTPNPSCGTVLPGNPFCFGDGSGTACPCGNASPVGNNEGCLSSLGTGALLLASGNPSLANDTIVLSGTQMPNSSALYFQGTTQQNSGMGTMFGDGLRCAGGSVIRLGTKANAGGASQYPAAGDPSVSVKGLITAPSTHTYQIWYRNAASFCQPETFNLSNGWQIIWGP